MKKNIKAAIFTSMMTLVLVSSCKQDLDLLPKNDVTAETVYSTPAGYKESLAKVYGAYALTGNAGPSGDKDIKGQLDEGDMTDFLRTYFYAQELTTDEAILAWSNPGLPDFHNLSWNEDNQALAGLYYRSLFQITLVNEFLRQSTDDKLSSRGVSGTEAENIRRYRAEARFLRAFQYWVLMDLYANPPFITENDALGSTLPKQTNRAELFTYVESELKAIEAGLAEPSTNEYGRADKGAAWALLARLYLNAQVYIGTPKFTEAITYSKKVIAANYSLLPNYTHLMLADNNVANPEFILTINYDGNRTQSYGGTTFFTHAATGGAVPISLIGVNGGWGGIRTTKNLPTLFPDFTGTADKRAQFYQTGQNLEINDVSSFTDGFAVVKYRNRKRDGSLGSSDAHADIDFPLFRLAEQYLIYAEAVLRGGTGGDKSTAITYINNLRTRAYGNTSGNVSDITLDFILDERGRELYWECFRRTDLIRYNKFVEGTYLWPWKGGTKAGRAVDAYRKIFPIPAFDLTANPNLVQNPQY
jgi:starch-binding outer membrane protein, SusD/RagB family